MISQEHELDSGLVQIETEKQAKGVRRDEMMCTKKGAAEYTSYT
jgi:hypothetical protein